MDGFIRDIESYYRYKQCKMNKKKKLKIQAVNWVVWKNEMNFKAQLLHNFKNNKSVFTPGLEKYITPSKM